MFQPKAQLKTNTCKDERVERLFPISEMRTPLILILDEGDPRAALKEKALQFGCVLWELNFFFSDTETAVRPEETKETFKKALNNGDWLYISQAEFADSETLREVGRSLLLTEPDFIHHPQRSRFRLWISVTQWFQIQRLKPLEYPYFPAILLQNAYLAVDGGIESRKPVPDPPPPITSERAPSRTIVMRTEATPPQENSLVEETPQDPSWCRTGPWFHRVKDFWDSQRSVQEWLPVYHAIDIGHTDEVKKLVFQGLPVNTLINEDGLSPLHFAIGKDNEAIIRFLFESGADPTKAAVEGVPPPLFAGIKSVETLQIFIDADIDVCAIKHDGHHLRDHPLTTLAVKDYLDAC